ncbi:MAG: hypothetical protein L0226_14485 [Acidobacteria bacterium]|nr:hypothetical protein [Acidobacteriota bacterium]
MTNIYKRITATSILLLLIWPNASAAFTQASNWLPLSQLINKGYLELLEIAPALKFTPKELEDYKRQLEQEKGKEKKRLEDEEKLLKNRLDQARRQLEALNKQASRDTEEATARRRDLHCEALKLEREMREKRTAREQGVPVAYENIRAKLDLIEQWPARKQGIAAVIASGRAEAVDVLFVRGAEPLGDKA